MRLLQQTLLDTLLARRDLRSQLNGTIDVDITVRDPVRFTSPPDADA